MKFLMFCFVLQTDIHHWHCAVHNIVVLVLLPSPPQPPLLPAPQKAFSLDAPANWLPAPAAAEGPAAVLELPAAANHPPAAKLAKGAKAPGEGGR